MGERATKKALQSSRSRTPSPASVVTGPCPDAGERPGTRRAVPAVGSRGGRRGLGGASLGRLDADDMNTPTADLRPVGSYPKSVMKAQVTSDLSGPRVAVELVRRGYSRDDIEKVWGGDLLRVWREVEQVAAESG